MFKYIISILLFNLVYQKSDVYFTKEITSSKIVELYKKLNVNLKGRIGLKVHTGEEGGPYFLRPDFLQDIYNYTNGTFIETNTAYNGSRYTTERHRETLKINGWLDKGRHTVIMDEDPTQDIQLNLTKYEKISKNYVGKHIEDFDSIIVLAHFKGHSVGGFGGALKQLSIGFASKFGKKWIHYAGKINDTTTNEKNDEQEDFTASMADAATSVVNYFKDKGGDIVYINTMVNISLRCDCAGKNAPEPKIKDIGILASTDPVAIDKACLDLIKKCNDNGKKAWLEQLERLKGENTITIAEKNGIGSQEYNLIDIDVPENKGAKTTIIIIISIACFISLCIAVALIIYIKEKNKNTDFTLEENLNDE